MLWLGKYRPTAFKEMLSHKELIEKLEKYTLATVPNLIIHGQPGHNKRTLLYAFISHLYGRKVELRPRTVEMKINSTTLAVDYLESDEVIEINPAEYGTKDRHIVQGIIKEMAQAKPIMGLFEMEKRKMKLIVINKAERLSKDAQAALRRTMEVYSKHFKIFMVCSELSKLIEPIRSRALFIRVRGFTDSEIAAICQGIIEKEGIGMSGDLINGIVTNSKGNAKRAVCLLELLYLSSSGESNKRQKLDAAEFKLDWEKKIEEIITIIEKKTGAEGFLNIRKILYELLTTAVSPDIILLRIARQFCKENVNLAEKVVNEALVYNARLHSGSKPLLHLEAFAAALKCINTSLHTGR